MGGAVIHADENCLETVPYGMTAVFYAVKGNEH